MNVLVSALSSIVMFTACAQAAPEPPSALEIDHASTATSATTRPDRTREPIQTEIRYLTSTEDNTIYTEVPTSILEDIRTQLAAAGKPDEIRALESLYDFETGRVRDAAHARAAQGQINAAHAARAASLNGAAQ